MVAFLSSVAVSATALLLSWLVWGAMKRIVARIIKRRRR